MKNIKNILLIIFLLFFCKQFFAQNTEAIATIDTNTILIGDQIDLNLKFTYPSSYLITWPLFNDTIIKEIEIIKKAKIDTIYSENNELTTLSQKLTITSFDSGYYAIPPIRFLYKEHGDTNIYTEETQALLLEVITIPVDTTQAFKDIKVPIKAPYTFREAMPWILIGIAAILITLLVIYYIRKHKKAEPIFRKRIKPKLPPHQVALDALEKLKLSKLWQTGKIKEYHTELTDIIRTYIHDRFGIHAIEMTSDEISDAIIRTVTNEELQKKLKQTLILADLVKFAKEQPLPLEHDSSLNNSIAFVKGTILALEDATTKKNEMETKTKINNEQY
ncbi:MAG: hypothetical protein K8R58_08270 [Bacteroidales bacterium]|nr:hypothetical protein [Bacteroidales bacterium]